VSSSYTPGPWRVGDTNRPFWESPYEVYIDKENGGARRILSANFAIGELIGQKICLANVSLAAAAPDLYEALKAIRGAKDPDALLEALRRGDAAIKKAEGKA
jgi:hypothetical protein